MTDAELQKLRGHYHALLAHKQFLDMLVSQKRYSVDPNAMQPLVDEIHAINKDFPGLLPQFNPSHHVRHIEGAYSIYDVVGVQSYLAIAVAKLEVAVDTQASTPVTETRGFTFVRDSSLRKVIERDYLEIQRAFVAQCWKSVIILSGGAIEAILTDLLLQHETRAKASKHAGSKSDIRQWDLKNLIDVAVDLKLVEAGVEKLSQAVREYRNLVHPGNEVRVGLKFGAEEARIALEVLHMLHRDLSR